MIVRAEGRKWFSFYNQVLKLMRRLTQQPGEAYSEENVPSLLHLSGDLSSEVTTEYMRWGLN